MKMTVRHDVNAQNAQHFVISTTNDIVLPFYTEQTFY